MCAFVGREEKVTGFWNLVKKTKTATGFLIDLIQWRFTSTETMRRIRDGKPRMFTSTFTKLLSSELSLFKFSFALRPQRPWGLLGSRGRPPRLPHSSWALSHPCSSSVLLYVHRDIRTSRDWEPRTSTSTSTQLLSSDTFHFSVTLCPLRPY